MALVLAAVLGPAAVVRAARLHLAVFNFQMKTPTPRWAWMQKGLADRITTDFTRSRRITVVARDEMQLLARQLRWVPEMATQSPDAMAKIKKHLRVDHLVTGVYSVVDGRVEIIAQIVHVDTRKEVARKAVRGPAQDVLDLQRRLSGKLLGWFSGVPSQRIVPHLPVWTVNIAATRALYKGLHLYDEGRYAEAWLHFRQAQRNDPAYLEAHYWVARMYYFMDRYKHARCAYERFVYMDSAHPRVGDAIKEYLHTHEKLDLQPEKLLKLYDDFSRRFPDAMIYNELGVKVPVTNRTWLQVRSAQVLAQLGRDGEAVVPASKAMATIQPMRSYWGWEGWAYRIARRSAHRHNMLTGRVLVPKGLQAHFGGGNDINVLRFARPGERAVFTLKRPRRILPVSTRDGRKKYPWIYLRTWVLAPDGYAFRSLRFDPIIDGEDGLVCCYLSMETSKDMGYLDFVPIAQAHKDGLRFDDIPRSGVFDVGISVRAADAFRDPQVALRGLRAEAEFEKIGPRGAIEVSCLNTDNFVVHLNGRLARRGIGLIGMVPEGEHELEFRPLRKIRCPLDPAKATVRVKAGRISRVEVVMPWKKDSPLASWTTGTLIGRDYPRRDPCLQDTYDAPSIQADDKAIRVFWSRRGDLWSSMSTDGARFSPPARLPMPVSSGWIEQSPICLRDESGRFLLAFRSDREGQHQQRVYLCWSRDAVRWSRPTMVVDRPVNVFDLIRDSKGRLLWADATDKKITIMRSKDGYLWRKLAQWQIEDDEKSIRLLRRDDGAYDLFIVHHHWMTKVRNWQFSEMVVTHHAGKDAASWSDGQRVTRRGWEDNTPVSAMHVGGQTVLAAFRKDGKDFVLFRRKPDGAWQRADDVERLTTAAACMTHHPRWGFMIAWHRPPDSENVPAASGPFLIRGKSVEQFFVKNSK